MRILILLLIMFSVALGRAQHSESDKCELYPLNKKWIAKFKRTEGIDARIGMVVNKVLWDGDYFYVDPEFTGADRREMLDAIPCTEECKLRIGIIYGKNQGIILDLNRQPALEELLFELSSSNINRVELKEYEENDIYGHVTDKRSGVVLFSSSKELKKMIRRLPKNSSE